MTGDRGETDPPEGPDPDSRERRDATRARSADANIQSWIGFVAAAWLIRVLVALLDPSNGGLGSTGMGVTYGVLAYVAYAIGSWGWRRMRTDRASDGGTPR